MRPFIEKELSAAKHAVGAVRDWLHHRTKVMKRRAFERPLNDLGQNIDDVERRAQPAGPPPGPARTPKTER